jgi:N-ethylmaleimide reductase
MNTPNAPDLFTPYRMGPIELKNRLVMAPLTRSRAGAGNVPSDMAPPTTGSARAPG